MKVITKDLNDTSTKITVTADSADLLKHKNNVTAKMAKEIKLPGFRAGKVPAALAEKHLDANYLQGQVLEEAINQLYIKALNESKIKVVSKPKIEVTKYVPFTDLIFTAEVDTIGQVKLPDYKNVKIKPEEVKITDDNVKEVLDRIQKQSAIFTEVEQAAKIGDRVTIDFDGKDENGQVINNTAGKDYPLMLGSKTFIKGFEEQLVGLKKGENKAFNLSFPKDYYLKLLAGKKVKFNVSVKKVENVKLDDIDDKFASKVGPFKTLTELKLDIKKQLMAEGEQRARQAFEEKIIKTLVAKTKVALPISVVEEQIDIIDKEFKRNLSYRGEKFEDYLANNLKTEDQYREDELKPLAEERLKAGLVLAEIASIENITVTPEEIKIRIQVLKNQYKDEKMRAELDKPENQRDIASRLITEKTIAKLVGYVSK